MCGTHNGTRDAAHNGAAESRVRGIFLERLQLDVGVDTEVIDAGLLDSVAFVQLLVELEEEFGLKVDVASLDLADFSSVARVARLVSTSSQVP